MDGMYEAYAALAALSGGDNCGICGEWHAQAELKNIDGETICPECVSLFFPEVKTKGIDQEAHG